MRDLIDQHAREMMLDLTGKRRPVPEMGRASYRWAGDREADERAAEAAEGGLAVQTHAGSGEGLKTAQRPLHAIRDAMRVGVHHHIVMDDDTADALRLAAAMAVAAVYDQAVALAAEAEPMPLASHEPWMEGDEAYRERLGSLGSTWAEPFVLLSGFDLDDLGEMVGLPRARLVPVEGCP